MNIDKEREKNFEEWLIREMPPGTVIGDPKWWAPRILRAARAALVEQKMRVRENQPANVRTCLPVVHPVEETPKSGVWGKCVAFRGEGYEHVVFPTHAPDHIPIIGQDEPPDEEEAFGPRYWETNLNGDQK